ncbi:MAG: hypothetical protein R3Y26_04995 [Rikenellaceae bacterium]
MGMIVNDGDKYTANITRKTPALLVFMLDLSSSMRDEIMYEGVTLTKAELLSRIINMSLNEIIHHCKKSDSYYDYFNIMVFGYYGDDVVNLLKPNEVTRQYITINDLLMNEAEIKTYESIRKNINGTPYVSQLKLKEYVKPFSSGKTPTGKVMKVVIAEVRNWVKQYVGVSIFPPVVFSITDGEFTDITKDEFLDLADSLKSIKTSDGNLLFYNIHLAPSTDMKSEIFPVEIEELSTRSEHAKARFEASSVLPKRFSREIALLKNEEESLNYKAFSYNSSVSELLKILNIGSLSIKRN